MGEMVESLAKRARSCELSRFISHVASRCGYNALTGSECSLLLKTTLKEREA